jgi:ribosomal protein L5
MRNSNSLEEVAEIHSLLADIKKEYTEGIKGVLLKNYPNLFRNVHTIPKLEKIQINRGLGLAAQNTNILKKVFKNLHQLQVKNL